MKRASNGTSERPLKRRKPLKKQFDDAAERGDMSEMGRVFWETYDSAYFMAKHFSLCSEGDGTKFTEKLVTLLKGSEKSVLNDMSLLGFMDGFWCFTNALNEAWPEDGIDLKLAETYLDVVLRRDPAPGVFGDGSVIVNKAVKLKSSELLHLCLDKGVNEKVFSQYWFFTTGELLEKPEDAAAKFLSAWAEV